jgi:hypothetical protein
VHRLARRSFLNAILSESNSSAAKRVPGNQALFSFLFLDQCGTRGVLQDSRTQMFREDDRAEYNRFRETGTETTSGI